MMKLIALLGTQYVPILVESDSETSTTSEYHPKRLERWVRENTADSGEDQVRPVRQCPKGCRVSSHQHAKRSLGAPYRKDLTYGMRRRLGGNRLLSSSPRAPSTSSSEESFVENPRAVFSGIGRGPASKWSWQPIKGAVLYYAPGGDGEGFSSVPGPCRFGCDCDAGMRGHM
jgi:hypothetical protein